jgi:hypothetical protein
MPSPFSAASTSTFVGRSWWLQPALLGLGIPGVPLEPLPLPLTVSEASGNISGPCLATRPWAGVIWSGMGWERILQIWLSYNLVYVDMSGMHAYIDAMVFHVFLFFE